LLFGWLEKLLEIFLQDKKKLERQADYK